jgi:hypothetical protein
MQMWHWPISIATKSPNLEGLNNKRGGRFPCSSTFIGLSVLRGFKLVFQHEVVSPASLFMRASEGFDRAKRLLYVPTICIGKADFGGIPFQGGR